MLPQYATSPARAHITSEAPIDGAFLKTTPGELNTPAPTMVPMTRLNPSAKPRDFFHEVDEGDLRGRPTILQKKFEKLESQTMKTPSFCDFVSLLDYNDDHQETRVVTNLKFKK